MINFLAFSNLPPNDRKELELNSVHSIRYLWLHTQNKNLNYFNMNENDYRLNAIYEIFPKFKQTDHDFKRIHETKIHNLSLDETEFSLYSALTICTGSK